MKKVMFAMLFALTLGIGTQSYARTDTKPKKELTVAQQATLDSIKTRIDEIRKMDKSQLSSVERKELKGELKTMKKQAKALEGGIYLSATAIIIIILLLILIL